MKFVDCLSTFLLLISETLSVVDLQSLVFLHLVILSCFQSQDCLILFFQVQMSVPEIEPAFTDFRVTYSAILVQLQSLPIDIQTVFVLATHIKSKAFIVFVLGLVRTDLYGQIKLIQALFANPNNSTQEKYILALITI